MVTEMINDKRMKLIAHVDHTVAGSIECVKRYKAFKKLMLLD